MATVFYCPDCESDDLFLVSSSGINSKNEETSSVLCADCGHEFDMDELTKVHYRDGAAGKKGDEKND